MRRRRVKARKTRVWRYPLCARKRRRSKALRRMLVELDYDEPVDDLFKPDTDPWVDS